MIQKPAVVINPYHYLALLPEFCMEINEMFRIILNNSEL